MRDEGRLPGQWFWTDADLEGIACREFKDQGLAGVNSQWIASMKPSLLLILTAALGLGIGPACAFEGSIKATLVRGSQTETILYTIVVHPEERPMDVSVALEHGSYFRPTTRVVAPYFGPSDAKLVGSGTCGGPAHCAHAD
jgi:hypothetical protein